MIAGIGPRTHERLAAQGLRTVRDLIGLFPRRYRELVELDAPADDAVGRLVRVQATVRGARLLWLPGRRSMVTVAFAAADGTPFAAPFFNQPWLKNSYAAGQARVVEGTLVKKAAASCCTRRAYSRPTPRPSAPCSCAIRNSRASRRAACCSGSRRRCSAST